MNTAISWISSLSFLSKPERAELAALHANADTPRETYRLINFLITDPEIGLLRYVEGKRLKEYATLVLTLQQKCLSGVKLKQEDWAPAYCNLQTLASQARADCARLKQRGQKPKPTNAERALAERNFCVADALENSAYHSYAQQGPATVVAIFEAMVKAEGCEAHRQGKSGKDAEKHARTTIARKIFELLTTNISVKQPEIGHAA